MPRVFRLTEFIASLPKGLADEVEFLSGTLVKGDVAVRCKTHKAEYTIKPGNMRRGQKGCPLCATLGRRIAQAAESKVAIANALTEATKRHGGKYGYDLVRDSRVVDCVDIVCPTHGVFRQALSSHAQGHGCDECAKGARGVAKTSSLWVLTRQKVESFCAQRGYTVVGGLDEPRAQAQAVQVTCKHHGVFDSTVGALVHEKGCWKCFTEFRAGKKVNAKASSDFVAKAIARHGDAYDYSQFVYVTNGVNGYVRCKTHNKVFSVSPGNHLAGKGCPKCGIQTSHAEDAIADWLRGLGVVVEQRNRVVIAPREIDVWLPEHSVGIEYHGNHWHAVDYVGNLHWLKWSLAQAAGIQLIQIFEDEWLLHEDIVKQRILAVIGKLPKTYARKCEIVTLESGQAREFLDDRHLQGFGVGGAYYGGLMYDGRLVAVATFGKRTASATAGASTWEVLRYASEGRVVGGFGKLFSAFLKATDADRVVSYCDLRYGTGKLYDATGFVLEGVTEPDYFWLPKGDIVRVPRYKTQKHKLETHPVLSAFYSPDLSEDQICTAAAWRKIKGVGHQRWVFNRLQQNKKPDIKTAP